MFRGGDRITRRHVPVLLQRIDERSVLRQPVVQMRSGCQAAGANPPDRLTLLDGSAGMNS